MHIKQTETLHPSKKSKQETKASQEAVKATNKPTDNGYVFEFDGTSYIAISKGGTYNVRKN